MKRFVCYMMTLMVIVFGGIVMVNYTLDPGHVYHGQEYVDKVIEGIKDGYHVEGINDIDERLYKLKFAKLHQGETFDFIALGSSRIMTVSEDVMHDKTFLNLSISSCQIEEMIAFYQICKDLNIHYSNVLIPADPSLFNGHYIDDRWKRLGDYVNEFMGEDVTGSKLDWDVVWNLFSAAYFRTALRSCFAGKKELKYVKTTTNDGGTFRTDGSITWERLVREAPQSVIEEKARTTHFHLYKDYFDMSEKRVALFTKLLERIKADGVKIYLVRSPFHPVFYKKLLQLKGATDAFDFVARYAKENNIPLISSFNPADEGLNETDFYDGPHVRKEVMDKILERELFSLSL